MFVEEKREGEVKLTPMLEPWRQSCLEAANDLATNGWQQGAYGGISWGNRSCLLGALRRYEPNIEVGQNQLYRKMWDRLSECPEAWNDAKGRTQDEVIQFLEKFAFE